MSMKRSKTGGRRAGKPNGDSGSFAASLGRNWKKLRKRQKAAIVLSLMFLVLIGVGIWVYAGITNPIGTLLGPKKPSLLNPEGIGLGGEGSSVLDDFRPEDYYDQNIVNFVLLGFDTSEARRNMSGESWYKMKGFAGGRPDSIRVISINLDTNTSNVISIPRDTYIQIADTGIKDKINSSYMYGRQAARNQGLKKEEDINAMGLDYVMKTISNVFGGVPMHYYMAIDFDTVVNFVDAIGGVWYDVDIEVRHPETGELMLEKGWQLMNGTQAFIYLQDRTNTPDGDIGRTQHHTAFMKAMVKQLLQYGKLVDALNLIIFERDKLGTIETNMTMEQIMAAGYIAAKRLNLTDINPHVLACRNDMYDGISYVVMDQVKRSELIKEVFGYDFPVQPEEHLIDTVPKPPINFTGELTSAGVALSWEAGDIHNRAYTLWRNGELIASDVTAKMYLDTDYPAGSLTYEIQAVNGESVSTKVSCTVNGGAGGSGVSGTVPTNLTAVFDPVEMSIKLSWSFSGDDVSFTVYKSDGDGTGSRLERNITKKSYKDFEVVYGKTYTYWVTAVKSDGTESARSAPVQVNTGATPTPGASCTLTMNVNNSAWGSVTPVTTTYAGPTTVAINATPAAGYRFKEWQKSGSVSLQDPVNSASNRATVTGNCTLTAVFEPIPATPAPTPESTPESTPEPTPEPTPESSPEPTNS